MAIVAAVSLTPVSELSAVSVLNPDDQWDQAFSCFIFGSMLLITTQADKESPYEALKPSAKIIQMNAYKQATNLRRSEDLDVNDMKNTTKKLKDALNDGRNFNEAKHMVDRCYDDFGPNGKFAQ